MKTITRFLAVLLVAVTMSATAQINLKNTFGAGLESIYLKHSGFKLVQIDFDTINLYNMNFSLFKKITIPGNWGGTGIVWCLSEGLFDTDTLHIDYVVTSYCCPDSVVIYKDNGTVVFREDSATLSGQYPGIQGYGFFPIFPTDSGTYMIISRIQYSVPVASELYLLPGSFPCVPGCSGSGDLNEGVSPVSNKTGNMKIYPNPAVSYANIYYTLPQGTTQGQLTLYDLAGRKLKEYTVISGVDHLRLTTSDITAGTYFYQLSVNGNAVAAKKIVVVK